MEDKGKICEKCGKPLNDADIFCGFCGHFVPKENLNESAKEDLEKRSIVKEDVASNATFSVRVLGLILIAVGILSDLVGMLMISSASVDSFKTVLFTGSVCFFIGLVLTFGGRVY